MTWSATCSRLSRFSRKSLSGSSPSNRRKTNCSLLEHLGRSVLPAEAARLGMLTLDRLAKFILDLAPVGALHTEPFWQHLIAVLVVLDIRRRLFARLAGGTDMVVVFPLEKTDRLFLRLLGRSMPPAPFG